MPPSEVPSPSHACLVCAEVLSNTSTPSPGLASVDADSKRAGSAKRRLNPSLGEEVAGSTKARRRGATPSQISQLRQMQLMIECARPLQNNHAEIEHNVPKRMMGEQQAHRVRDLAVATIVMQSNLFDVSTRTFVLAIKIFDNFLQKTVTIDPHPEARTSSQQATNGPVQDPLACFIMACKFCETFAPRLTDVVSAAGNRCTVQDLRNAENNVLDVLRFDIGITTAIDVMHKLLGFTTSRRAAQIRAKTELGIKVSCCSRALTNFEATDMAVAALLYACDEQGFGEEYLDFVPRFMMTEKSRDLKEQLKAFIALNVCQPTQVAPSTKQSGQGAQA